MVRLFEILKRRIGGKLIGLTRLHISDRIQKEDEEYIIDCRVIREQQ